MKTNRARTIADKASFGFLKERIRYSIKHKQKLEDDIKWMELGLQRNLNESDFEKVIARNKKRSEATFLTQREKHICKLDALRRKHEEGRNKSVAHTRSSGLKWIVNLSSCELNDSQQRALQRGLNFAPTPTRIPTMEQNFSRVFRDNWLLGI